MSPCISFAKCCDITKPKPVPPYKRVTLLSAWLNASKIVFCCSLLIPIPVSVTVIFITLVCWSICSASISMVTEPCSVNLMALVTRLTTTCLMRIASPISESGSCSDIRSENSRFLLCALGAINVSASSILSRREKGILSITILPASSLEKSRISLMIINKLFAEPSMVCK